MLSSKFEKTLFTKAWNASFADKWNASNNSSQSTCFRNTGPVLFGIDKNEKISRESVLSWDKTGKVHVINDLNDNGIIPTFLATVQVWESVIYGYYTPIHAVVNKKMKFQGNMKFAMQFSQNFEYISDIAIKVNRAF